ncbi:MAG: TetR/AcrR family transcriptional regulator [Parvibaculum sp.]|nr:TetR/AcrR family transcriptional regulator [Parvibaculum sp.]
MAKAAVKPTAAKKTAAKPTAASAPARPDARVKLLEAGLSVIRAKGYAAATVDELCAAAGVTKGAFFHHFKSKDEFGVAAADHWSEITAAMFAASSYHDHADPLERVLGYIALRRSLLQGGVPDFSCLVGTMVQEVYETSPSIREACARSICGHAATLEADIDAAMRARGVRGDWTAKSLALHTQAVLQGAFILAKARGGAAVAAESIDHLTRYVELLFAPKTIELQSAKKPKRT